MTDGRSEGPSRRAATIGLGAALASGALSPGAALAQMSGIEILAPGALGDGPDQLGRAIAEGLATTKLTPRAIPVNVPIGRAALADFLDGKRPRATMMVMGLSTIGSLQLGGGDERLGDCRPLARLLAENQPLVVPEASRLRTIKDLTAALVAEPETIVFAGRERGGADHQLCAMLALAVGADPKKIVYRDFQTSSQVSFEVLTGKVSVGIGALLEFLQQIRGGTVRALALASPERMPDLDVPTLREQGVDVATRNWRGAITRASIGGTLTDRFGEALRRLAGQQGWREMIEQRQWTDLYQPAEPFGAFIESERLRISRLLKDAMIT